MNEIIEEIKKIPKYLPVISYIDFNLIPYPILILLIN